MTQKNKTIFSVFKSQATTVNSKGTTVAISTQNANVDLFKAGRKQENILALFSNAYSESKTWALANLLYILDRKGKGDRQNFKDIFKYLIKTNEFLALEIAKLIGKYGRYDYLLVGLEDKNFSTKVLEIIAEQLASDIAAFNQGEPISLLAKWLPTPRRAIGRQNVNGLIKKINANNPQAKIIYKYLAKSKFNTGIKNAKDYRQTLTQLRNYLNITEAKLSSGEKVDFDKCTSLNLSKYNKAFERKFSTEFKNWLANKETIKSDHFNFEKLVMKAIENEEVTSQEQELMDKAFQDLVAKIKTKDKPFLVLDASGSMWGDYGYTKKLKGVYIASAVLTTFAIMAATKQEKFFFFSNYVEEGNYFSSLSLYENIKKLDLNKKARAGTNFEYVAGFLTDNRDLLTRDYAKIIILSDQEFNQSISDKTVKQQISALKLPKIYVDYKQHDYFTHFYSKDTNVAVIQGRQQIINDMVLSDNFVTLEQYTYNVLGKYLDEVRAILTKVIEALKSKQNQSLPVKNKTSFKNGKPTVKKPYQKANKVQTKVIAKKPFNKKVIKKVHN